MLSFQKRIGATQIVNRKLDIRGSYAFVGMSGPSIARNKINWIREEISPAGNGPTIINIDIETGIKQLFLSVDNTKTCFNMKLAKRFVKLQFCQECLESNKVFCF